jgi:hypothetical protein
LLLPQLVDQTTVSEPGQHERELVFRRKSPTKLFKPSGDRVRIRIVDQLKELDKVS